MLPFSGSFTVLCLSGLLLQSKNINVFKPAVMGSQVIRQLHRRNTHQSQHARRLFDGSAATEEAHDHHQSPRRNQDVHAYGAIRHMRGKALR